MFPITVDFDNYCNFLLSRPQPLQISTDQRLLRRRYYFCKRLIFAVCEFIVTLLNCRRFSSHLNV